MKHNKILIILLCCVTLISCGQTETKKKVDEVTPNKQVEKKYTKVISDSTNILTDKIENLEVEALYIGDISEIQIENKVLFVKNYQETVQVINLNSEQSEVCKLTNREFLTKFPNVNLKTYSYFFMNIENEYNKNYS